MGGLRGALWWMLGWRGAVRGADMPAVCGALPITGKKCVGEDEAGSLGVSQINSSSCSLLSGGVKAWWQTASTSDGTNCHWQPLTLLPF